MATLLAFQSVYPLRSVGLSVSGAVAPSAPAHTTNVGRTLPQVLLDHISMIAVQHYVNHLLSYCHHLLAYLPNGLSRPFLE